MSENEYKKDDRRQESERVPEYLSPQTQVLGEKVAVYKDSDQDAVETKKIADKWPVSAVCDGVSQYDDSGPFAAELAKKAVDEIEKILPQVKSHAELQTYLTALFLQLNNENQEKKNSAASTLAVSLLYYPEDHSELPKWHVAGIGDSYVFVVRATGEMINASPGQSTTAGTVSLPTIADIQPFQTTIEYAEGDMLFSSTDGFRPIKVINKLSKGQVLQSVLKEVVTLAETGQATLAESFEPTTLGARFAQHHGGNEGSPVFIGPYMDDVTVSVIRGK